METHLYFEEFLIDLEIKNGTHDIHIPTQTNINTPKAVVRCDNNK